MISYRRIFTIFMTACLIGWFSLRTVHTTEHEIINAHGKPSQDLLQLFQLTGIEHDGSFDSIVKATQAAWIRTAGIERWNIVDQDWTQRDIIMNLFKNMGCVDEIKPTRKNYDYALWMGAAYPRVKDRLLYIVELYKQGIIWNQIVVLSGCRPLTLSEQQALVIDFNVQADDIIPATEADMMRFVYERIVMPDGMKNINLTIIDVPMKVSQDGAMKRPTTGDTIDAWMALNPFPGSCLVVSNQPYVAYQNSVTQTLLPKNFVVESCGKVSDETNIDIYLDNLARLLYQEKKRIGL